MHLAGAFTRIDARVERIPGGLIGPAHSLNTLMLPLSRVATEVVIAVLTRYMG